MILEQDIRAALLTMSAVTAKVGAGDAARIRPDRLHQGDSLPAIIIEVDREEPQNTLDGRGGLVIAEVNVKCRAASRLASRQLAEAVRTNETNPGTGLAGYSGTFDAVLDDLASSFVPDQDGGDGGSYDTDMSFVVTYAEAI